MARDELVGQAEEPLLPAGLLAIPRRRPRRAPAGLPGAPAAAVEAGEEEEEEEEDAGLPAGAGGHPLGEGVRATTVGVEEGVSGLPLLIAGRNVARGGLRGRRPGRPVRANEVLRLAAAAAGFGQFCSYDARDVHARDVMRNMLTTQETDTRKAAWVHVHDDAQDVRAGATGLIRHGK